MEPKITIIILNWNGKADTIECLDSLKYINYSNYNIILVDNGSTDGSVEYFQKYFPHIYLIKNQKNLGFAEGNNVAIKEAISMGTDYVLLLNNDTIVDPNLLKELIYVPEINPDVGIVGPKIYYYNFNGRKDVIWFAGGKINKLTGKAYHVGNKKTDSKNFSYISKTSYITGCTMLIRAEAIKNCGMFDSKFFAYFEDVDLCLRISQCKWKLIYFPKAKVWHKVSRSSGVYTPLRIYYGTRNRILFIRKHSSKINFFIFLIIFSLYVIFLRTPWIILNTRNYDLLRYVYLGLLHGTKNI